MLTDNDDHSEEDYSIMILKNRLAKGEINIEEFNIIKTTLLESSLPRKVHFDTKNESKVNQVKNSNAIVSLPLEIVEEKRITLEYNCTYLDGHSLYKKPFKGKLLLHRARKNSEIIFVSKGQEIKIHIPIRSMEDIELSSTTKGFFSKKEDMVIRIRYSDKSRITQMPVFDLDNKIVENVHKNIIKMKEELSDPIIHSFRSREGVKSLELDPLSPKMHIGEAILWSQKIPKNKSDKHFQVSKIITNYRVFTYDVDDQIMRNFIDLVDVDDVVVIDRRLNSKSESTTYFVGGYGNHVFGGVAPSNTQTHSNSTGDVVIMHQGKPKIILNHLPDPDGVANMVKSVMNEMYPRI
jgi:hypothetical protein